jgi:hypothetical protein
VLTLIHGCCIGGSGEWIHESQCWKVMKEALITKSSAVGTLNDFYTPPFRVGWAEELMPAAAVMHSIEEAMD